VIVLMTSQSPIFSSFLGGSSLLGRRSVLRSSSRALGGEYSLRLIGFSLRGDHFPPRPPCTKWQRCPTWISVSMLSFKACIPRCNVHCFCDTDTYKYDRHSQGSQPSWVVESTRNLEPRLRSFPYRHSRGISREPASPVVFCVCPLDQQLVDFIVPYRPSFDLH